MINCKKTTAQNLFRHKQVKKKKQNKQINDSNIRENWETNDREIKP